ncbi:ABC transporter permease [Nocardioides marmorisolisilvae]|uniref:ABC transporter permease n=1 Tax=Nocardioides marmorisolisilvae TaxID=1542737 RepID=A0A3N0DXR2_9ACTN|nr:ABC transporter permease [Nocardioides marmorisolisilvae]RNL80389.1 ABC transporter permease [Nocardioides marmorisolisilvae]
MSLSASDLSSHEAQHDADSLEPVGTSGIAGLSPTKLALRRFRRDKLSMISFSIVVLYVVAAIAAPLLVKLKVLKPNTPHSDLLDVNQGGIPLGKFGGITWHHPLGIEPGLGRDVLSRLWLGITYSLGIALSATILAVLIGTVLGIVSGFVGGIVDSVVGRIIDLTLSFPQTLMLLALSGTMVGFLGGTLHIPKGENGNTVQAVYVILVLALFGWPPIARLVRGQVLSIREREFIEAARALGASKWRIYFKEIVPNLWAPLLVYFTLTMPAYVSAEAALAYLQVSVKPPTPTLGNVLTDSIAYSVSDFEFFFFPAALIAIIVVSFNLLGDGLRDALDPKSTN